MDNIKPENSIHIFDLKGSLYNRQRFSGEVYKDSDFIEMDMRI